MNIYKIEQFEGTEDLGHIDLSPTELEVIDSLESSQLILEDTGSYIIGLFTDEYISMLTSIFRKYNIKFSITDVTAQFVKTNIFKIKSYVFSNVTIDDVLDKINKSGMESLNEIDYMILNK